jgi:hypothetical protein
MPSCGKRAFGRDGFSKFDAHFLPAKAARQMLLMTHKFNARIDFAAKFDRFKSSFKFS